MNSASEFSEIFHFFQCFERLDLNHGGLNHHKHTVLHEHELIAPLNYRFELELNGKSKWIGENKIFLNYTR